MCDMQEFSEAKSDSKVQEILREKKWVKPSRKELAMKARSKYQHYVKGGYIHFKGKNYILSEVLDWLGASKQAVAYKAIDLDEKNKHYPKKTLIMQTSIIEDNLVNRNWTHVKHVSGTEDSYILRSDSCFSYQSVNDYKQILEKLEHALGRIKGISLDYEFSLKHRDKRKPLKSTGAGKAPFEIQLQIYNYCVWMVELQESMNLAYNVLQQVFEPWARPEIM